jgi:hypothetical protein
LSPTLAEPSLLEEAITLHQRLRFDPQPAPPGEKERLAELARLLTISIKRGGKRAA